MTERYCSSCRRNFTAPEDYTFKSCQPCRDRVATSRKNKNEIKTECWGTTNSGSKCTFVGSSQYNGLCKKHFTSDSFKTKLEFEEKGLIPCQRIAYNCKNSVEKLGEHCSSCQEILRKKWHDDYEKRKKKTLEKKEPIKEEDISQKLQNMLKQIEIDKEKEKEIPVKEEEKEIPAKDEKSEVSSTTSESTNYQELYLELKANMDKMQTDVDKLKKLIPEEKEEKQSVEEKKPCFKSGRPKKYASRTEYEREKKRRYREKKKQENMNI
jgi:hypothetical protein